MKNLTQLLFTLFCLCLPTMLQAQDRDDSKYLAGAVPEVDGKVVFTKDFSIPGTKPRSFSRSPSISLDTGIPVQRLMIVAISSSVTDS